MDPLLWMPHPTAPPLPVYHLLPNHGYAGYNPGMSMGSPEAYGPPPGPVPPPWVANAGPQREYEVKVNLMDSGCANVTSHSTLRVLEGQPGTCSIENSSKAGRLRVIVERGEGDAVSVDVWVRKRVYHTEPRGAVVATRSHHVFTWTKVDDVARLPLDRTALKGDKAGKWIEIVVKEHAAAKVKGTKTESSTMAPPAPAPWVPEAGMTLPSATYSQHPPQYIPPSPPYPLPLELVSQESAPTPLPAPAPIVPCSAVEPSLAKERCFVLSVGEGRKLKIVDQDGAVVKQQDVPLLDSAVRIKLTDKQVRCKLVNATATEFEAFADKMTVEGERRVVLEGHVRVDYLSASSETLEGANKVVADRVILRLNKSRIESITIVPVEP
jgi:hypothetical protein